MQDACWPSHFEEFKQVLFSEPCSSYPSSHANKHVSLVTKPLQFMRPFGGFIMPSQGRPGSNVQRTTEMKVCLQKKQSMFIPFIEYLPSNRSQTTLAVYCQSHCPKQITTTSFRYSFHWFRCSLYLIKRFNIGCGKHWRPFDSSFERKER